VADAVPTSNLSLNSTTGTISNFTASTANITLGTIPTLTAGTTTSTAATITSATITTGTIPTLVATTLVTTGTGTASAPAIVPTGDTNTGLFFPAADTLAAATQGTERGRIDSSGKVLIGTTSNDTGGRLEVKQASGETGIGIQSSGTDDSKLYFRTASGSYGGDILVNGSYLKVSSGTTERLRIDSSGNVGIGTTSFTAKLSVVGAMNVVGANFKGVISALSTDSQAGGVGAGLVLGGVYNSSNERTAFAQVAGIKENSTNDNYAGALAFYTRPNGGDFSERLRIDSSGRVGIGTGSASLTNRLVLPNAEYIGWRNAANNGEPAGMGVGSGGALEFITGSTERLRITSGGEVYIAGTTDQGAYNLQVNGTGVWGAGAYVNGSDSRIKEDIQPLASGLDVVEKLNPVTYKYKETWSSDQSIQSGFIAQELLTALDGQIYIDGVVQQGGAEGYYSVAYQNLIAVLTKAIQELKAENDSLKARVAALEAV